MCSGTVIAQNIIQTAAHCADGNTDSYAAYTQTQLQHNSVSIVIPAPPYHPTTNYVHSLSIWNLLPSSCECARAIASVAKLKPAAAECWIVA